ncbi:MAG: MotA/TolQ/ExbB proton channel family protein [Myxococcota bacterium]|nr:MotA/TolQ/ExbB proton channel family protein [Myxococcota bacterium]
MPVELTELWLVGGGVFVVLIGLAGAIWAALVGRWWSIFSLQKDLSKPQSDDSLAAKLRAQPGNIHREAILHGVLSELDHGRALIVAMIAVAPLLGLLGTVGGMIETFEGLGQQQLYTQSGGVAGGIASALLTTQLGLVVSVPALIASRIIDSKAKETKTQGVQLLQRLSELS